ncbi:hypothetical protein ACIA8C_09675 [Nocardia sp. NPDC051321]|uniref:hypothetical protein n=1 Tax=Nocardia sp. NPDC051321 TaxID=3364323 RepID=UPI0037AFD3F0
MGHSINEIGQLLVSDLATAYGIAAAPDKAMAFFQGVPVDDKIVQNGKLNQLRLGLWLAGFDTTLILTPATAAITPPPGGASATGWYRAIVADAQPVDANSLAGQQLSKRLNNDRSLLAEANIDQPLTCEPPDWPIPDAPYWQSWSSASHTASTTAAPNKALVAGNDWAIHTAAESTASGGPGDNSAMLMFRPIDGTPIIPPEWGGRGDDERWDLQNVDSGTDTTTTTSTDITIRFDYTLVYLTRRAAGTEWWDDVLLNDPAWYLPGYEAGTLLGRGSGGAVPVLPYALVLAKNAVVTGTWDNQQNTTRVGPLRVSATGGGDSVAIGWQGMQAIALLADVLPDLPPEDDPAA